ncbi:hypothetical protein EDB19DRAFT_1825131 [Suillus lakei]|nr:hypothetical protein EDB19DRAFT_1825131 [Suillus lakei]
MPFMIPANRVKCTPSWCLNTLNVSMWMVLQFVDVFNEDNLKHSTLACIIMAVDASILTIPNIVFLFQFTIGPGTSMCCTCKAMQSRLFIHSFIHPKIQVPTFKHVTARLTIVKVELVEMGANNRINGLHLPPHNPPPSFAFQDWMRREVVTSAERICKAREQTYPIKKVTCNRVMEKTAHKAMKHGGVHRISIHISGQVEFTHIHWTRWNWQKQVPEAPKREITSG